MDFNNTSCLPVIGKDGKITWIFKLEDLREVVPEDVYSVIEEFVQAEVQEQTDALEEAQMVQKEREDDGYLQMLCAARDEIGAVLKNLKDTERVSKRNLIVDLEFIYNEIDKNL